MNFSFNDYFLVSWSGGKDSAMALRSFLSQSDKPVVLLTTVNEEYGRIAMHGVRTELLQEQADALGLPLEIVGLPKDCSDEEYGRRMEQSLLAHQARGCRGVVFGDLFLQDIRDYRERRLSRIGMPAFFPLWGSDTSELGHDFIRTGFRTIITCVDTQALYGSFSGRFYDETFLNDLPATVDPCGENGEFHSFVFDGPLFRRPVRFERGESVLRDGRFCYCELTPVDRTIREDRQ